MKKIIISIIVLCLVLSSVSIVNASTGTVNLIANNKTVKPGETFTVTVSVSCVDGINGINTTYNYDQDKLEFVSAKVSNDNWANLGTNNSITVISNSTSKITSSDIYVLTFKVKDNATAGIAKVGTSDIMIDSDLAENSSFNVSAKSIDINIITDNNPGDNNPGDNNPGDNKPGDNNPGDNKPGDNNPGDNKPGDNNPGDNKPGDNKPGDNNPGDNKPGDNKPGDNKPGDNKPGDNNPGDNNPGDNKPGDNEGKDSTITDTKLPQTGEVNLILILGIGISSIAATIFLIKLKSVSTK